MTTWHRLCCWLTASTRDALRSERGVSTVMFALTLPMLLAINGLAVDGTRLFVERRGLQNAADAAALAAAIYLPSTNPAVLDQARQAAISYVALNGFTITAADVEFVSDQAANDRVVVRTRNDVGFVFARSMGFTIGAVSSRGAAQIGVVGAVGGTMPWGVEEPEDGFIFGDTYCLKLGSSGGGGLCAGARQGNFHALDIDDVDSASGSVYRDRIASGSHTVVEVGQVKNVVSGNMNGPTQQGTGCSGNSGRMSGNSSTFEQVVEVLEGGTYQVLDWTNSRLVIVPVVRFISASQAEVLRFSVFFLEDCGSNGAVIGRFIDTIVPGGSWTAWNENAGTRMVRLVD